MRRVAAKLGKSVRWPEKHVRAHPCGRKIGVKRIFTPSDFATLLNRFPKDTGDATQACPALLARMRSGD